MNRELAELVAEQPARKSDPPLREYSPVVRTLTDIADLLLKILVANGGGDPRQVEGFPRPRPMVQIVLEEKRKDRRVRMVNKIKPKRT